MHLDAVAPKNDIRRYVFHSYGVILVSREEWVQELLLGFSSSKHLETGVCI